MKLRPLSDHIIIKPIREDKTTKSGIVLPETVEKERSEKGEVIAVGPGKISDDGKITPLSVKIGDKVLFTKYGPNEIKINDEELLIASESDILAVIEE